MEKIELRDFFVAHLMSGKANDFCENPYQVGGNFEASAERTAVIAYKIADILLKVRRSET